MCGGVCGGHIILGLMGTKSKHVPQVELRKKLVAESSHLDVPPDSWKAL